MVIWLVIQYHRISQYSQIQLLRNRATYQPVSVCMRVGVSKCDGEITVYEWHYIQFKKSVKSNKAVMTNEFLHKANLVAFVILLLA